MAARAVAAAVAVAALALLGIAQLVFPSIAEHRLRHRLERSGSVQRVDVHSFPAIKLLWDDADRVEVRMRTARPGPGRLADLLAQTSDTDRLDADVGRLRVLTLVLSDVRLRKRGHQLTGSATVTPAALQAALPPGFDVRPVAAGGGELVFEGTADLLGQRFSGRAVVAARDGRLLLAPDIPFGGLLTLTLFADPRVDVTGVGARPAPGGGFTLTASARVG
jgi:hypothetical protein